jgi:hypothetical protein
MNIAAPIKIGVLQMNPKKLAIFLKIAITISVIYGHNHSK